MENPVGCVWITPSAFLNNQNKLKRETRKKKEGIGG